MISAFELSTLNGDLIVEIKILREFLVDDPEEPLRTDGRQIMLRLFECQIGDNPTPCYVSAEQKPFDPADYKTAQIFKADGAPAGVMPVSGYNKLLAARDEYRAAQRATALEVAKDAQATKATDKEGKAAWHQSVAERRTADAKARAVRYRAQLQGKLLRLRAEAVRVAADIEASEIELLALPEL